MDAFAVVFKVQGLLDRAYQLLQEVEIRDEIEVTFWDAVISVDRAQEATDNLLSVLVEEV